MINNIYHSIDFKKSSSYLTKDYISINIDKPMEKGWINFQGDLPDLPWIPPAAPSPLALLKISSSRKHR
jgi:hypothetical protein